jgi:folate-binding protein YgfZ
MDTAAASSVPESPLALSHRSAKAHLGEWFGCALPSDFGDWEAEYRFARNSVALIDKNYRAYLSFTGADRVRYLNAILTNNIKGLSPGNGVASLFLNPQGQIQAEIETYAEAEKLFCVSFAMIRKKLIPAIEHYIIMDDVVLTDETERYGTIAIEGPRAAELSQKLTGVDLADLPDLGWKDSSIGPIPCRIIRRSAGGIPSAEFLTARQHQNDLWNLLGDAAKSSGGGPMGYTALNALRLEQAVPWFGYDFGEKQIPHEAGLEISHISYTKGCYTGQEIVERVRSRGQVNRTRVLFRLAGAELPPAGTPILSDGKEIGSVTRSACSPALQSVIGMGYLRREKSAPGSEVQIGGSLAMVVSPPTL